MVNTLSYYYILVYQSILISFTVSSFSTTKLPQSSPQVTPLASSSNFAITVYDNVLSRESCDILHQSASKTSGLSHRAFTRPFSSSQQPDSTNHHDLFQRTIETTLDAILTELGDDSMFVEYWTRQEWRHIEAHADVDEHLAKEQDAAYNPTMNDDMGSIIPFRYPENGHVLYLKIGTQVQGPTCVFPNVQSGGDLVKDPKSCGTGPNLTEMMVVPAVDGRLLRFQGNALHAVPRPADLWLRSFVMGAPEYQPEEIWGRSVILFNTWRGEPPKDVPLDQNVVDSTDSHETSCVACKLVNQLDDWVKVTPLEKDRKNETDNQHDESSSESPASVKIWLLGNERRRGYPMRTVKMKTTSNSSLKEALFESDKVSRVYLLS